jgi:cyclophilin family peptidyl-prolyl cis-trans isomerase
MASTLNSKRMFGIVTTSLVLVLGIGAYYYFMMRAAPTGSAFDNPGEKTVSKLSPEAEKALETTNEQGLSQATAVIQTTRGKITFKFYSKDAPNTSIREAELIQSGFYNGLTFHRVVPGFVVQGGDPTGNGTGGSGTKQKAEFNARKHIPGAVAMARSSDPNSADSQFYITLGTHPHLDGAYTVFGQVIEGMEVANQLQVGDRMTSFTLELQ